MATKALRHNFAWTGLKEHPKTANGGIGSAGLMLALKPLTRLALHRFLCVPAKGYRLGI